MSTHLSDSGENLILSPKGICVNLGLDITFILFNSHYITERRISGFITPILKSLVVPVIWLALIGAIYSWITPFFVLNHIFFPANEEATLKTKQPIRFQGLLKITNQIAGKRKMKDEYHDAKFATFVSKSLIFPPKKWMNLISNQLSTALNWPSPVLWRFQNGCNKVVWNHTYGFKSNSCYALVRFWNHTCDFSPYCTSLGSITIINHS